ncbi:MAG: phospholipase A, partial [Melioribacteraceae bacterium]|nr:phospholipase A [Melioribacteraceae bacterium]
MQILHAFVLLFNLSLYAQTDSIKKYAFDLSLVSEVNSGNSYVTIGGGLGNIEPLIFEANLIPNFIIRQDKDSKIMGVFTPQIIMRMYQETSSPVKTPSYMPQITIYYSIGKKLSIDNFTIFGKIAHHSNGQQDDFYLENGEINYDSGNFSTNYIEIGIIKTFFDNNLNAAQFFSTSFEIHPPSFSNEELEGIYSFYRWNNQFSIFKLPFQNNENGRAKFSLKGQITWLFRDVYDWDFFSFNRFVGSLTFYYHPPFLEEIGLFVQYYHGQDY